MSGIIGGIGAGSRSGVLGRLITGPQIGSGTPNPGSYAGYAGPFLELKGAGPTLSLHDSGTGSPMWEIAGYNQDLRISDDGLDRFKISSDGEVLKPSQTAFHAYLSSNQDDPDGGTNLILNFDAEMFDIGSNFNISTKTFTAPIAGKYLFNFRARLSDVDSAANYYNFLLKTTGTSYNYLFGMGGAGDKDYWAIGFSVIADMAALETAYIYHNRSGGADLGSILSGTSYSEFSGYLLG